MILFALRCARGHEFEGWFRDSSGFKGQQDAAEIACPHCGDTTVEKAVMAPRLARSRQPKPPAGAGAQLRKTLTELRRQIEANCDYVGARFAEEARRIHYGETNPRGIYGEASSEESRDLANEGISFGQIPWVPYTDG